MKLYILTIAFTLILTPLFARKEISPSVISVDSFASKISRQSKPQIIDVRTPEEFKMNHINGAVHINLKEGNYVNLLKYFDKNKPVFIYAIQNNRPDILAEELNSIGYTAIYELKGGIASWIGGGYPYYTSVKNNISYAEYKQTISDNNIVLVEIGTKFCGLCMKAKAIIDSLLEDHNDSYQTVELELELYNNPQIVAALGEVSAVPTILLYKEGKIIWKRTGLTFNKEDIKIEIAKAQ
jgi:rhodanese-related sulfurtransferase